jgi:hypothetical protein
MREDMKILIFEAKKIQCLIVGEEEKQLCASHTKLLVELA